MTRVGMPIDKIDITRKTPFLSQDVTDPKEKGGRGGGNRLKQDIECGESYAHDQKACSKKTYGAHGRGTGTARSGEALESLQDWTEVAGGN